MSHLCRGEMILHKQNADTQVYKPVLAVARWWLWWSRPYSMCTCVDTNAEQEALLFPQVVQTITWSWWTSDHRIWMVLVQRKSWKRSAWLSTRTPAQVTSLHWNPVDYDSAHLPSPRATSKRLIWRKWLSFSTKVWWFFFFLFVLSLWRNFKYWPKCMVTLMKKREKIRISDSKRIEKDREKRKKQTATNKHTKCCHHHQQNNIFTQCHLIQDRCIRNGWCKILSPFPCLKSMVKCLRQKVVFTIKFSMIKICL